MEAESTITEQRIDRARIAAGSSKSLAVFAIIGLSAVFLVSLLFTPSTGEYVTLCGFKNFTGLPCPGCGLTHSFCALAKGNVTDAFGFNLLGPPLYLAFALMWIRSACVLLNKSRVVQQFDRMSERFNLVRGFVFAFAVYGIARIVYLVVNHSAAFHESPLSRLIDRIIQ